MAGMFQGATNARPNIPRWWKRDITAHSYQFQEVFNRIGRYQEKHSSDPDLNAYYSSAPSQLETNVKTLFGVISDSACLPSTYAGVNLPCPRAAPAVFSVTRLESALLGLTNDLNADALAGLRKFNEDRCYNP